MKLTKDYIKQVIKEQLEEMNRMEEGEGEESAVPSYETEEEAIRAAADGIRKGIMEAQKGIRQLWIAGLINGKGKSEHYARLKAIEELEAELRAKLPRPKGMNWGRGDFEGVPHHDSSGEYMGRF